MNGPNSVKARAAATAATMEGQFSLVFFFTLSPNRLMPRLIGSRLIDLETSAEGFRLLTLDAPGEEELD
jgi:hypothetical protein